MWQLPRVGLNCSSSWLQQPSPSPAAAPMQVMFVAERPSCAAVAAWLVTRVQLHVEHCCLHMLLVAAPITLSRLARLQVPRSCLCWHCFRAITAGWPSCWSRRRRPHCTTTQAACLAPAAAREAGGASCFCLARIWRPAGRPFRYSQLECCIRCCATQLAAGCRLLQSQPALPRLPV
jgi:hypothetical protein